MHSEMLESIFTVFFSLCVLVFSVDFGLRFNRYYKAFVQLEGPGPYLPLIGNVLEACLFDSSKISNILIQILRHYNYSTASGFRKTRENARRYRKGYAYYSLGKLYYQVYTAENFEKICSVHNTKKGFMYSFLNYFIAGGLLTAHGLKWQMRRRMITPTFHFNILKQFLNVFREESHKLIDKLEVNNGDSIDITKVIPRLTLNVICETAMGIKIDEYPEANSYQDHIHQIGDALQCRIFSPLLYFNLSYWLFGFSKKTSKIVRPVHSFSKRLIEERRLISKRTTKGYDAEDLVDNVYMSSKQHHALLDTLFKAQQNNRINETGIQEEVDTFVFTGYDTVSAAIIHSLLVLANHPDVQAKLHDHIQQALALNNYEPLQIEQYSSLDYLDRVVREVLRLYPSAPFVSRELTESLEINGVILPPGTNLQLMIYDLHRDPEQFFDPLKFDPDRFLPENVMKRHPFAYLPFSAGSRNCIGQKFAVLELKTVLISILLNFILEPITRIEDMVFIMDMILHTNHPVKMRFIPRHNKQSNL